MTFVKFALITITVFVLSASQGSIDEDILITDDPLTKVPDMNDTSIVKETAKNPERSYLAYTDFALPLHGTFTLAFERTIQHRKTLGITGILSDEIHKSGLRSVSLYLGMNFYSKKAFNGWFIAPNIGYSRFFLKSRYISINLHGGYKWELPHSFLIGFGLGPGISRAFVREKNEPWLGFDFFGGFYLGKAFGALSK